MSSKIFEDKSTMPSEASESSSPWMIGPVGASYPKGDAPVRVTMTPAEERALRASNYPRYDAMDVDNIVRPRRGHGY